MVSNTNAMVPAVRPPQEMPPFDRKRRSLMRLRPRHLLTVEEYGFRAEYDREALAEHFKTNWYRLFGALRKSKAHEVPSDALRKEIVIHWLLDLIEMRREE